MSSSEQKETISLGDEVMFIWSGMHNVYKFSDKAAFDDCDFSQAILLAPKTEDTYRYKANQVGKVYFSCEIPGHCEFGQKLELTVLPGIFCVIHALSRAAVAFCCSQHSIQK